MELVDALLPTLAENLALDEALLLQAEAGGGESLRFWHWPRPAVVMGAGGAWQIEANVPACQQDHVPIVRRSSGGGTVLLGPGCLLYCLVLSYEKYPLLADLHAGYRFIMGRLADAFRPLLPDVVPAGISDLALGEQKFSGNSQQRKRRHVLHHGTLLHDFDVSALERYLLPPPRMPEYRAGRTHEAFVTNVPLTVAQLRDGVLKAWPCTSTRTALPDDQIAELVREKYGQESWHLRR